MKFPLLTLITHTDPHRSPAQRLREVVDNAVLGEELGFDGYGVGERHAPVQVIDKIGRYHERSGHEVMHLPADGDGLTDKQHRATLELFQSEIAPAVRPLQGR